MGGFITSTDPKQNIFLPQKFENTLTFLETLAREIIMESLAKDEGASSSKQVKNESDKDNLNLRHAMSVSLKESGLGDEAVASIVSIFPDDVSVNNYLHQLEKSHIIRGYAFPNFESLKIFTLLPNESGKRKRSLQLSPRYLISLLQVNPDLLDDSQLTSAKIMMKKYLKATYAGSDSRLTKIRDNVTKNIRSFLKNDSDNDKCESLDDFIERKDYPVRVINESAVNAVLKQATQAKPEDHNASPFANQTSLNCMLCPSATKTNESGKTDQTKSGYTFDPPVYAHVCVERIFPRDTITEIKQHFIKEHNDSESPRVKQGHGFIAPCLLCLKKLEKTQSPDESREILADLYVCCLQDCRDHQLAKHSDMWIKMLRDLRTNCSDTSQFLKFAENELMVKCCVCSQLFPNKVTKEKHESLCFSKSLLGCEFYGTRLYSPQFETPYMEEKRKDEENEKLIAACKRIVSKYSNTNDDATILVENETDQSKKVFGLLMDRPASKRQKCTTFAAFLSHFTKDAMVKNKNKSKNKKEKET